MLSPRVVRMLLSLQSPRGEAGYEDATRRLAGESSFIPEVVRRDWDAFAV